MNENKSRDIFYGVVAIATLIVALVGATLAYFSISDGSSEDAVNAQATVIKIDYNDSQQVTAAADELIPSSFSYVKAAYERKAASGDFGTEAALGDNVCIDDGGMEICSIYRFTVTSDAPRTIAATLNNEQNGFNNLSYALRNVNTNEWMVLDNDGNEFLPLTKCSNLDGEEDTPISDCWNKDNQGVKTYNKIASNSVFGYTGTAPDITRKTMQISATQYVFDLVIFLNENNKPQNDEQGQVYSGTIVVDVIDGGLSGQISGCIGEHCKTDAEG